MKNTRSHRKNISKQKGRGIAINKALNVCWSEEAIYLREFNPTSEITSHVPEQCLSTNLGITNSFIFEAASNYLFKMSRQIIDKLCTFLFVLLSITAYGQQPRYPATINPVLGIPNSIFLSDYASEGTNALQASIVFNDFNEASWTFKLRIKIQSNDVRLETRPGYTPPAPIVLAPGVIQNLTGADWEQYFSYPNLNIAGTSVNNLISSGGRLPEGVYSFCFQVLDYDTGDPLSQEICRTVWLKLTDAPRIKMPICGTSIDPALPQVNFAWQAFDTPSPNAESPDFQLTIWELTETVNNIQTAVGNGQAVQVFQSVSTKQSTYIYGPSDPPLELGKQYVYRVQAIDPSGRDSYKNNGNSEFCNLYYGWPAGGSVDLVFPAEGGGFRKKNIPSVQFGTVKPKLPTQAVSYQINVVPWLDGQSREQAIDFNQPWFLFTTPPTTATQNQGKEMPQNLAIMQRYVWQVKAYTGAQEVGKSNIGFFNGPSLMESFWAGGHRVEVDYIDGVNLNDISGGGRIRFSSDPNAWTPITFSHIQITNMGDFFRMSGGEFFHSPTNLAIALNPDEEVNGLAYYDVKRFRVSSEGIYAEGRIRWNLPFATNSTQLAKLVSEEGWASFNNLTINTSRRIAPGNEYDLLEPQQFRLSLSNTGMIYVYDGTYRFDLNGVLELPQHVAGAMNERVKFPFRHQPQLFYMEEDSVTTDQHALAPLPNATLALLAQGYVLDLSEQNSPGKWSNEANWKGIYIHNFNLRFSTALDKKGQLGMPANHFKNFNATDNPDIEAWVNGRGLDLKVAYAAEDSVEMLFQTFPSFLKQFNLTVLRNQIISEASIMKGAFTLPVVSTERQFAFTVPVNNTGFTDGYLEDLENTSFVHNEGEGDQEIRITIRRAVLSSYEKISMTLDLEWPSMGVVLETLRGFNAWGDYSIGFDRKNGTVPLVQQYNATLSNYPITINVIGAASNDGSYVFATTADAGLGDDVGGGEGAPSINVYSVMPNAYVPADAAGVVQVPATEQISFEQASANATQQFSELEENLRSRLEISQHDLIASAEQLRNQMSATAGGTVYTPEQILGNDSINYVPEMGEGASPVAGGRFNARQRDVIEDISRGFIQELSRPLLDPLRSKTDSLNAVVKRRIDEFIEDVASGVETQVSQLVDPIAKELIQALTNDKVDVATPINAMALAVAETISLEIKTAMQESMNNNVVEPIRVLLEDKVYGRINKHINDNASKAVFSAIVGDKQQASESMERVITDAPYVLDSILRDVLAFINMDNIRSTVEATASDFINNISLQDIAHDLRMEGEQILVAAVNAELQKAVGQLVGQYANDIGLGNFGGGGANPINFVGVAQRFREGGIRGVFSVDPVRVMLRTPVIDLDGFMSYTPKHPVYGDVWLGDIDMTIKVPKLFAFNAIYFNGKKDGINYWFCQITPPDGNNTPYQLGKPLSKKAKPLQEPVDIGIAEIVGASGRLYHHMKETPGEGIIPDASMRYGAYMHFVFFDAQSDGVNLRLEVSGEINSSENGDYTIAFDGNLQVQSTSPEVMEIDAMAVVQGTVMIRYNSAEEHFFGYASVIVKSPSLCAQASLLVDVKPGAWRIAIGSRQERIIFVPGCGGWSPTGWLDLNQSQAELGLGVQFSAAANEEIDLSFVSLKVLIETGFAFGIVAVVQYKPSFALMRAGIWLDAWCIIDVGYKFKAGKNKSIRLADIYIRGDMMLIFNPSPTTIEGTLNGKVKITLFSFNFNAKMRKEL